MAGPRQIFVPWSEQPGSEQQFNFDLLSEFGITPRNSILAAPFGPQIVRPLNAPGRSKTRLGIGYSTNGTASTSAAPCYAAPFALAENEALSMVILFVPANTTDANRWVVGTNLIGNTGATNPTGRAIAQNGANVDFIFRGSVRYTSTGALTAGVPIVLSSHGSGSLDGYVNGVYVSTYSLTTAFTTQFQIAGGGGAGGGSLGSVLFAAGVRGRVDHVKLAKQLLRSPHEIYEPRRISVRSEAAGYTHPTLSNARMGSLTSTTGVPLVDYAF